MRRLLLVLHALGLFASSSLARAQEAEVPAAPNGRQVRPPGPSITDAELAVLCADAARWDIGTRPLPEESPSIQELERDLKELAESEKKASRALNAVTSKSSKQFVAAREALDDIRAQREATEQTLRDVRAAQPLRELKTIVRNTDSCIGNQAAAKKKVCEAHAQHHAIPWKPAAALSACMRAQPLTERSMELLARERPELQVVEASPKALAGTSLESAILRETTDFLVLRGEEELELFATQVLSEQLCDDPIVKSLLSHTCALTAREEPEPLFAVTLAALREAARIDLEGLPKWLSAQLATKKPDVACALEVGWQFSEDVLHGADVAETLADLGSILDDLEIREPCKSSPQFLARLRGASLALHQINTARGVNVVGLIRSGDLESIVSRAAPELTDDDKLSQGGKVVREVLQRIRELQRAIEALEADPTGAHRAAVVDAALRTIEPLLIYAGDGDARTADYFATVSQIVLAIGDTKYISAVVTLTGSRLLNDAFDHGRIGRNFRVLVTLGATIAQADSTDAVKNALDEAAAPLQSWRRKNVADYGATITGLFGFVGAYEFPVERTQSDEAAPGGVTFAPSLALGVDFHGGLGKSRFGLFLSVLDLGALATFRVTEPDTASDEALVKQAPEVRIEQVLAPGLYPYFGIGPFDMGLIVGFVPSLRAARDRETRDVESLDVIRVGLFVAVDISVLPLF